MAFNQDQIDNLLAQHVNTDLLELEDLVGDYDPVTLTTVELTEFTERLSEIRTKLKAVRTGYRAVIGAMPGDDNADNRHHQQAALDTAKVMVMNHQAAVKEKIAQLRDAEQSAKIAKETAPKLVEKTSSKLA